MLETLALDQSEIAARKVIDALNQQYLRVKPAINARKIPMAL
jgi:hypothetical protein